MTTPYMTWHRLGAGHYTTADWTVRSWKKGQWWLFKVGALRGRWQEGRDWRRYVPFRTMAEAMSAAQSTLALAA